MSTMNGRSVHPQPPTFNGHGAMPGYGGPSAGYYAGGAFGPPCPVAAYGSSQRPESHTVAYQAATQHQNLYNNPNHRGPYQGAAGPSMGFQEHTVAESRPGSHAPSHWEASFASTYDIDSGRGVNGPVGGTQYAGTAPVAGYAGTASLGGMMSGTGPAQAGFGGQYGSFGSAAAYGQFGAGSAAPGHSDEMAAALKASEEAWAQLRTMQGEGRDTRTMTQGAYTSAGAAGAYGGRY